MMPFGIRTVTSPLVPEGRIWFVTDRELAEAAERFAATARAAATSMQRLSATMQALAESIRDLEWAMQWYHPGIPGCPESGWWEQ